MPELPEVEIVRLGLNSLITTPKALTIVGGKVLLSGTLSGISCESFLAGLIGQTLITWQRRGKYLLCQLSGGGYLGVHLRMTGRLLWCDRHVPEGKHTRVRLFFSGDRELRFEDQRTFGKMWLVPCGVKPEVVIPALKTLGAEPLSADFTADYFHQKIQPKRRAIKTVLLDQTVVAGIGNIYADEALFVSRIHPETSVSNLSCPQVNRLRQGIIQVLKAGLQFGGTTFSDFQDINGMAGNYLAQAWVFRRHGQPCLICQTPVQRLKLGGRSTHFCPSCQAQHHLHS